MSEHTPRSYGDMVMGEYLKGLAEIAKEHPSKIEQLEALERAAHDGPWFVKKTKIGWESVFNECGDLFAADLPLHLKTCGCSDEAINHLQFVAAARNAMPHLLAVAKAAKFFVAVEEVGGDAHDQYIELAKALSRLEAQ